MGKTILTIAACAAAASGAFGALELGSIVTSFNATIESGPSTFFPLGLAYDGAELWTGHAGCVGEWTITGSRKTIHDISGYYCSETAYDRSAGRLYVIARRLISPYYILGVEASSGSVVSSFVAPSPFLMPSGLTFADGYLYIADTNKSLILKTTADGSVVSSIDPGVLKVKGLAWDGDTAGGPFLFACEMNYEHTIHQIKASSGSVVRSFDGPPFTGNIVALTWDGEYLWACQNYAARYMYAFQFIAHAPEPAVLPTSLGKVKTLFR